MAQKRNPQDALFRAAESAERAFLRRKIAELRQNAREAQQQKNWPLAESLWREGIELDPTDRAATIGLANALISIGKNDEAEGLVHALVAQWPQDENGPMLLARLAEARGDNPSAIAQWRRALVLTPGKIQALIRLGRLLLVEGQFTEAGDYAKRLSTLAPDNPAGATLLADIAQAQGDLAGALLRRKELAGRYPDNALVLRDYGRALIAAGDFAPCDALIGALKTVDLQEGLRLQGQLLVEMALDADHTDFWKAAHHAVPGSGDFIRRYAHAALTKQHRKDSIAAMALLLANPPLRLGDANFVIGVVNILDSRGETSAIRRLVRDFLKALKGTGAYRLAALRLSRIILRYFPRGPYAPQPGRTPTDHMLAMLRAAPVEPTARAFIEDTAALQIALKPLGALCLFDTDLSRAECQAFVAETRARLSSRTPMSFIRVGDGESNALGYEPSLVGLAEADAAERELVWWGRALEAPERAMLDARALSAMQAADGLGVPTLSRILRDIRLDRGDPLQQTRPGRGIRAALRAFAPGGLLHASRPVLTSAYIQHDLEKWNLYGELFAGLTDIVAVSCHPGLPAAFQALFDATIAKNILIPPRHASLTAFGLSEPGPKILPEMLDETVAQLGEELGGRLVLVGAGYAGKHIIREARTRGAVALDLGSIFDYWMGAATRSYQTASLRSPEPLRME